MPQKVKYSVLIFLLTLFSGSALPSQERQEVVLLNLMPRFQQEGLQLNHYYQLPSGDSVLISSLRFYLSHIQLWSDSFTTGTALKTHYLIDVANPASQKITIPLNSGLKFNTIRFVIGIDSATNYRGASEGELDPTNGMYWTWQSGYINFKLDGRSNLSSSRNKEFNWHIGGYRYPFITQQQCTIAVNATSDVGLHIQLDQLVEQLKRQQTPQIMSPGKSAVELSKELPKIISCVSP